MADELHFKLGKGRWGINLGAVDCPICKERMSMLRFPDNLQQMMWGGWTCPKCRCRMDKWGKAITESDDDRSRA